MKSFRSLNINVLDPNYPIVVRARKFVNCILYLRSKGYPSEVLKKIRSLSLLQKMVKEKHNEKGNKN